MTRMKRSILVSAALFATLPAAGADACGDKFQRVGRGARYQRGYAALYPACILVYSKASSPATQTLRELEPALKHAGHKLLVVKELAELGSALRTGHYNLVLTGIEDTAEVEKASASDPRTPIIPVLVRPSKEAIAVAQKRYPGVVEAPGKKSALLESIDQVLEARAKAEGERE